MSVERFEVATIAAARERGSDYCALAHGQALTRTLGTDTMIAIADGTDEDPERAAVFVLARQVAKAPAALSAADLSPLRRLGFTDADILDVVLAAAVRCFFSSVLSASGAQPGTPLIEQDPTLVAALTR